MNLSLNYWSNFNINDLDKIDIDYHEKNIIGNQIDHILIQIERFDILYKLIEMKEPLNLLEYNNDKKLSIHLLFYKMNYSKISNENKYISLIHKMIKFEPNLLEYSLDNKPIIVKAYSNWNSSTLNLLLEYININKTYDNNNTLMHYAMDLGFNNYLIKNLLSCKPNLYIKNSNKKNVIDLIVDQDIAKILIEHMKDSLENDNLSTTLKYKYYKDIDKINNKIKNNEYHFIPF